MTTTSRPLDLLQRAQAQEEYHLAEYHRAINEENPRFYYTAGQAANCHLRYVGSIRKLIRAIRGNGRGAAA